MSMAVPSAPAESPSGIPLQWNTASVQAVSVQKQDTTMQLPQYTSCPWGVSLQQTQPLLHLPATPAPVSEGPGATGCLCQ